MIRRMSRRMTSSQRRPLHPKHLPIFNPRLPILRIMFEDSSLGTQSQQIRNPMDMVPVPVRQQRLVHGGVFLGEDCLEMGGPGWFAFAGVD